MKPARPLRAILFKTLIYGAMPVVALAYLPWALADRNGAVAACHAWCRFVRWAAGVVVGIQTEVRQAIRKMVADVAAGRTDPGQLIIYPQGTRVAPGIKASYKAGAAALYGELGQPCVPVACNVGLFWPRSGNALRPGRAVVEFLPAIPPGLPSAEFLQRLEAEVEPASNRLMAEAGFSA
jgi:1-acyl-sn-glycerol-3-phosphate acyltransferase